MSKKSHLSWHDIELFLEEKIDKRTLEEKKNHYLNEFLELKSDCDRYEKKDEMELYMAEVGLYQERLRKNEEILKGLLLIFPNDNELESIIDDID